jgi:molybdate transport system permease protein
MTEIILRSIWAAGLAVCVTGPVGGAIGWMLARRRVPLKPLVDTLVTLPLVLPPVAVGVLLLYALAPRWSPLGGLLRAADLDFFLTFRGVVLCAAVMGLPLMVRSAEAAFAAAPREADEAALNLGAGRLATLVRITIPLAARGLLGGVLLAFARGLSEFGATMVVAG